MRRLLRARLLLLLATLQLVALEASLCPAWPSQVGLREHQSRRVAHGTRKPGFSDCFTELPLSGSILPRLAPLVPRAAPRPCSTAYQKTLALFASPCSTSPCARVLPLDTPFHLLLAHYSAIQFRSGGSPSGLEAKTLTRVDTLAYLRSRSRTEGREPRRSKTYPEVTHRLSRISM